MAEKENWEKRLSDNSLTILVAILVIAVSSIVLVVGAYVYFFNSIPIKVDAEPWGQFGDFFGGTLNPIFGFLSVMALLAALVIQSRELKVSSQELRNSALALNAQNKAIAHQSFEQTFFSWLDSYRSMLTSIHFVGSQMHGGGEYSGRGALQRWRSSWINMNNLAYVAKTKNSGIETDQFGGIVQATFEVVIQQSPDVLSDAALESWESLYRENEYQLDSLFRNLYRLILWIDSQHQDRMSLAEKWLYISIVRAQLSWIEMVYLFYNGYTERGKNFKKLVEKYALFDNLNFDSDRIIAHIKLHGHNNAQYAETAFDSRLARVKLDLPESTENTLAMAAV